MSKKETSKKFSAGVLIAGVIGAAIVGATGGALLAYNPYSQSDLDHAVELAKNESFTAGAGSIDVAALSQEAFQAGVDSVEPTIVEKEVPVEVEVIKTVTDTELVQATCDRLLYEDLGECQAEVKAEDAALSLAWEKLDSELADDSKKGFLADLEDDGIISDKDEVSVKKLYTDFEDIEIVKSDYDDDEYEFVLKAKLDDEEADEKVYVLFTVEVSDGEAEITDYQVE